MPKGAPEPPPLQAQAQQRKASKPYGQPGRVQFSACGSCRHRRCVPPAQRRLQAPNPRRSVKCDLKDKQAMYPDVDPSQLSCSNCLEREVNCVDEYAESKVVKQLRKGRRLQEAKARYGERKAPVVLPDPQALHVHQAAAIPPLHPTFFSSRFFARFQIQRPVLHPEEFAKRYCDWLTAQDAGLGPAGELIAKVLAAWAASYGVDEAGNAEPHLGIQSVYQRKERTNAMVREILHLIDVHAILRKPSWDGVRVLLLIMPLTEDVQDQLERLTMYEAAVSQVYTLCRIADVHSVRSGQGQVTDNFVRARIFWYAHVHEGITTGLKGGRLILQQEDIDAFGKDVPGLGNNRALVDAAGASDQFAYRFATVPVRIAAACRKIHTALTGPRARGQIEVDRQKLEDAWEALDTSYEELDELLRTIPPDNTRYKAEDISRFVHGWKASGGTLNRFAFTRPLQQIFIYECQSRVWTGLKEKVQDLSEHSTSYIEEVDGDGDARETQYATMLRRTRNLAEIAYSKCSNLAREVTALVRQYLGTTFFEYDAALVRDGSFFAAYLLADEPGCDEDVQHCLRAMDEMRWAFCKSDQYRIDLEMKLQARTMRERNRAAAAHGPSPLSDGETYCNSQWSAVVEGVRATPANASMSPSSSHGDRSMGSGGSRSLHSQSPSGMPLVAVQPQASFAPVPQGAPPPQPNFVSAPPPATIMPSQIHRQPVPPAPEQLPLPAAGHYLAHTAPTPIAVQPVIAGRAAAFLPSPLPSPSRAQHAQHAGIPHASMPSSAPATNADPAQQIYYLQQQQRNLAAAQQQTAVLFQQYRQQQMQQQQPPAPPQAYVQAPSGASSQPLARPSPPLRHAHQQLQPQAGLMPQSASVGSLPEVYRQQAPQEFERLQPVYAAYQPQVGEYAGDYYYSTSALEQQPRQAAPAPPLESQYPPAVDGMPAYVPVDTQNPATAANAFDYVASYQDFAYPPEQYAQQQVPYQHPPYSTQQ
ncbi:hypothetical protein AURDEDRAFT_185160 [Auricularia subglabra TFB-10046 SS5]|nr:hypothetical protein AURDEDRAFT_185160 [Auricularia subglabra TFB-10046 SS5]